MGKSVVGVVVGKIAVELTAKKMAVVLTVVRYCSSWKRQSLALLQGNVVVACVVMNKSIRCCRRQYTHGAFVLWGR